MTLYISFLFFAILILFRPTTRAKACAGASAGGKRVRA